MQLKKIDISNVTITDEMREKAKAEFATFDVDENGFLDRTELKRLLRKLCRKTELPPPTKKDIANAMAALDIDGDGQISFDGAGNIVGACVRH